MIKDRFLCMALQTYVQTKDRYARCHIRPCRAIFLHITVILKLSLHYVRKNPVCDDAYVCEGVCMCDDACMILCMHACVWV